MHYTGSCYCRAIKYEFEVSPDETRTSLCHCHNCKKFFGANFGITTKIPASEFKITGGHPKTHEADNGSGSLLHREFCGDCGGPILEYGVRIDRTTGLKWSTGTCWRGENRNRQRIVSDTWCMERSTSRTDWIQRGNSFASIESVGCLRYLVRFICSWWKWWNWTVVIGIFHKRELKEWLDRVSNEYNYWEFLLSRVVF